MKIRVIVPETRRCLGAAYTNEGLYSLGRFSIDHDRRGLVALDGDGDWAWVRGTYTPAGFESLIDLLEVVADDCLVVDAAAHTS
jgi:hypothetical protein